MSKVSQKNTKPEMKLRQSLHRLGLRYRLHVKKLPGSPDMVFPRFKAVLFVHGCFWHRHGCKATTTPKSSKEFWLKKFNDNVTRDKRHIEELANQGWRIAIVWECALKGNNEQIDSVAIILREWLKSEAKFICLPTTEFVN
ncbi:very short patch repair endonuclease [Methylomicrobium agile]|uniref:very short patch repair endonuclease n=1 Tax=Methylomicrobium agile TaxID=39774 RepID=UPI001FDFDD6A|nr:very short patch repair endonuclease [Methylomicrobium agile]